MALLFDCHDLVEWGGLSVTTVEDLIAEFDAFCPSSLDLLVFGGVQILVGEGLEGERDNILPSFVVFGPMDVRGETVGDVNCLPDILLPIIKFEDVDSALVGEVKKGGYAANPCDGPSCETSHISLVAKNCKEIVSLDCGVSRVLVQASLER